MYRHLARKGPVGRLALYLFRAQKTSRRAKKYGPTSYRELSYEQKGYSLKRLCEILGEASLGFCWGWKRDGGPRGSANPWVLYVDLPNGQVSFHSALRYAGPDYEGDWDGLRASEGRILAFTDAVLDGVMESPSSRVFATDKGQLTKDLFE